MNSRHFHFGTLPLPFECWHFSRLQIGEKYDFICCVFTICLHCLFIYLISEERRVSVMIWYVLSKIIKMGCISSKKESEDIYPNIFQVTFEHFKFFKWKMFFPSLLKHKKENLFFTSRFDVLRIVVSSNWTTNFVIFNSK